MDLPLYGNQCPATEDTSKQTQFNASLQVVYSFSVRLVWRHWSWSYNESDAWQDSWPANCQHHLMLLRNNPTPLKHHPWRVANCTASWMTAILQIRLHNLIHHTMNYNVHRASGSRTIHSGTTECMPIFCHCLHNSRYAISLYQLMVLPSSASSAWGGDSSDPSAAYYPTIHSRRLGASKTMELYC